MPVFVTSQRSDFDLRNFILIEFLNVFRNESQFTMLILSVKEPSYSTLTY